ncbi:expressed unknown protein [Seminavis robusta]|uniref:Uncharacterized protein n=1 Tax=Seminavis robusta TaxID=568900 RepID=A0A9N8EZ14_9STRA|nr:expressed unknown protein [Seminavis robusta]|eukprot:Sro2031_g311851.1  (1021) ;mRNA; r:11314-14376
MKEEVITSSEQKKDEASLGSEQEEALDPAVREVVVERAEAEAAQIQAEQLCKQEEAANLMRDESEEEMDTVVLDILTKRPTLEAAQLKRDAEAAIVAHETSLAVEQERPRTEGILLVGEDSEDKEHQHLMEIAADLNEAAKIENFSKATHASTDEVRSNEQEAVLVREVQQDGSVPGNRVEAPAGGVALPPPALQRTTQMRPQSQPGAFVNAPGGQIQRNPNLNYGLLGANTGTDNGQRDSRVGTAPQVSTNQGLVQANAVEDDTADLMHAHPLDLETAQHRALQKKQQQKSFLAAVLWLFLVAAIIVGFVVGTQKNKESKVVVLESTETPTVFGSMTPSEVPSSAPTGALDVLLDNLPDHTLASINNGSDTPQWRAWRWVAEHQNITFLPEWRKEQLFALATFFYAFEGENWNPIIKERWMDDTVEECDWFSNGFGIFSQGQYIDYQSLGFSQFAIPSCNSQGQFTRLHLGNLQLLGLYPSMPPEIALLTSLSFVEFFQTEIGGPLSSLLPTELYELTGMTHLDLTFNQVTGNIPSELGLLTSLALISLAGNLLSGHIPSEIGLFPSLTLLDLFYNQFTGPVPSEVGLLTSLGVLRPQENQLYGRLPSELGLLTSLFELRLHDNQLTDPFPPELWLLTSLNELFLGGNQFFGLLPTELGLLTSLYQLHVENNQYTGQVPSELGNLTELWFLRLNQNQLTGQVPSELGLLTESLTRLYLYKNRLTGTIPSELGQLSSLGILNLEENRLTSTIPSEFGALTALYWLQMSGNQLTGAVPMELWLLRSFWTLEINDNQFTGTIPTEIGDMTSLTSLALQNNILTGALPSQLNVSMGLRLFGNQFSGTMPEHLCSFLFCDCSLNETPPVSTCADLKEAPPDWPGRFPTRGADVMLNIQTGEYPEETSWVWQKETKTTGIWDTLESSGPLGIRYYLYSSLFPLSPNNRYKLVVVDSFGDGLKVPGWISLMAETEDVLYSYVSTDEQGTITRASNFTEITIELLVGADGSFDITNSTILCKRFVYC